MNVRITLFLLFFAFLPFFCAPKKVWIYEPLPENREQIVRFALSLTGAPYRSGAKGPSAFDCSGLVYYVYKRFGISLPAEAEGQSKAGYEISSGEILPGDLVFFKIQKDLHVGIMINRLEFIHASKSDGVRVSTINAPYWRRNLFVFRRVL